MKNGGCNRATLFQELAKSLVNPNIDWKDEFGEHKKKQNRGKCDSELNATSNSVPTEVCRAVPLSSLSVDLSMKKTMSGV